jgi:hypothetical protein
MNENPDKFTRTRSRQNKRTGGVETVNDDEKKETYDTFLHLVNLAPKELEEWLQTDESKTVGWTDNGGESVGHASGRRIVEIKRKKKDDLTKGDYEHMRKVVNYIKRHTAQGPSKSDPETSDWRYSLMNWGHDPLK